MARTSGSPNQNTKHWNVSIYNPIDFSVLWTKQYTTIDEIYNDFKNVYSKSQIVSYALQKRKCVKLLSIERINVVEEG